MNAFQKAVKYFAIALAVLIAVSMIAGIAAVIGFVAGGLSFSKANDGLDISKYDQDAKILSISVNTAEVTIVPGETLSATSEGNKIDIKQEGDKLSVHEFGKNIFYKKGAEKVAVTIPSDLTFDKIYLSNGAGEFTVSSLTTKQLEMELGAGKATLSKLTAFETANISCGLGETIISEAVLNNLKMDSGIGRTSFRGALTGNTSIDAGIGDINLTIDSNKENYTVTTNSGIGKITVDGETINDNNSVGNGKNVIDIYGGIGNINVIFTTATEVVTETAAEN